MAELHVLGEAESNKHIIDTNAKSCNKLHKQSSSQRKNKLLKIYCSNITSLSQHAIAYLFKNCDQYQIWSLLETRSTAAGLPAQTDLLKKRARRSVATAAVPSTAGGMAHGGELIAFNHHLNMSPIDSSILQYILSKTGAPLRICAVYIRLKKFTFVFANSYFRDKIGPTHLDNQEILMQLYLLQSIIGLRMFIYADFNCTPEELVETDWHNKLKMQLLVPRGPTTKSSTRKIAFALAHAE